MELELFSELYGCYYQTVKKILKRAKFGISEQEIEKISKETAFSESNLYILPKLIYSEWNLLTKKGELYYTKTKHELPYYLTTLQKMFIKSLLEDKKIRLFLTDNQIKDIAEQVKDMEPLFSLKDFRYFDQFQDGDPYEDEAYIKTFKDIHKALQENTCLDILYKNNTAMEPCLPKYLEYSAKDDKFRLYAIKLKKGKPAHFVIFNLSSIKNTRISKYTVPKEKQYSSSDYKEIIDNFPDNFTRWEKVIFFIFNEKNALERCTLQFSNYKKQIKYLETENCYECTMYYDKADEKEIIIRLLSFGPLIKVIGPDNFVGIIRKRISKQHKLLFNIN